MGKRTYKSKVQRVIDGDTLVTSGRTRLRLADVDAPELPSPAGRRAKGALQRLVGKGPITWTPVATDRYGRRVAEVRKGKTNVNSRVRAHQRPAKRK